MRRMGRLQSSLVWSGRSQAMRLPKEFRVEGREAIRDRRVRSGRCAPAGAVRAHLAARGTPIGPYDVLIAGQALARGIVLVTHNTAEFKRVPKLQVEDWGASQK